MEELENILYDLEHDSTTRCLILRSEIEDAFISGGDLKEFHTLKTAEEAKSMSRRMLSILTRMEKLPCWTIASVNAPAYGGGCEMMLAFDFIIASREATFGFTQAKFYLPPGWGGLTRLVERVGRSTALDWLAQAKVVDAETAFQKGLIDKMVAANDLTEKTDQWASKLIKNDRSFINNLKKGALRFSEARWKSIAAELENFSEFWESELHQKRVEKFLNRKRSE